MGKCHEMKTVGNPSLELGLGITNTLLFPLIGIYSASDESSPIPAAQNIPADKQKKSQFLWNTCQANIY